MQLISIDELQMQDPQVKKAYAFAKQAHAGQVRKDGVTPYIEHPIQVAQIAASMTCNPVVIAAALLHDVVEDTQFELKDIEAAFGKEVAELVAAQTENKRAERPFEETWQVRKEEALQVIGQASLEAKMIALSDKLSNLLSLKQALCEYGEQAWQWFHQPDKEKQAWYYRSMGQCFYELQSFAVWQTYNEVLSEIFQ